MPSIIHFDSQFLIQAGTQLFNTMVIIAILAFLLYKPILRFLDNRREGIANQLSSAEKQEKEASESKALYESKLRNIESERDEILDSARKRAIEREEEIVNKAKKEAEVLRSRALLDIEREKEKAKDEMKNQIIEISTIMASRYISSNIDSDTQNKLLGEVISDLGEAKWLN